MTGSSPPLRPVAYGLAIAGGAGLVAGAIFAVKLSNENSQLNNPTLDSRGRVVGLSQPAANALVKQAQSDALLANVFMVSGAVLVAAGTGVWVWGALNPNSGGGGEVGLAGRF